ncbi:MAG: YfiR family protein [Candidatus Competibacteraceae bacterium]|nr:YfiR family protein [Candidatus Competibacteraceae bacterium]
MPRRRLLLAWLSFLPRAFDGAAGWAETADESELKAAYIYRFAQFTWWAKPPSDEFDFCFQGQHSVGEGLRQLRGKTVGDAPVNVVRVDSPEAAKTCHVLFLHPAKRGELVEWVSALAARPILLVSDSPDAFQENVMIVFAMEPNRVSFKINLSQARASGLFLSAQMLKLAQEIR